MGEAKRRSKHIQAHIERAQDRLNRFIHLSFVLMKEPDTRAISRFAEIRGMYRVKV